MKIALSGAHGFLGSHLHTRLINLGHKVITVHHNEIDKFEGADVIFNLMSFGNMANQTGDDEIFNANIIKLYQMLNKKYDSFINFSTSAIQLKNKTLYSATKAAGEKLVEYYGGISIRPASVFGSGEAPFRFIPTVIRSLKNDSMLNLDPKPMHDWILAEDFIDGVMAVYDHREQLKGRTINISTGIETSNGDIVSMLEEISGKKSFINLTGDLRSWDSEHWIVDNSVLKLLGWKQNHSLREGLKLTYEQG